MIYNNIKEILLDFINSVRFIRNYFINKKMFKYGGVKMIYSSNEFDITPFDNNYVGINDKIYRSSNNDNDYIMKAIPGDHYINPIESFSKWKFLNKFKPYYKIDFSNN